MDDNQQEVGREAFDDAIHDVLAQRGRAMIDVLRGLQRKRADLLAVIEAEEQVALVLRSSSIYAEEADAYGKEVAQMQAAAEALTSVIFDLERIAALDRSPGR